MAFSSESPKAWETPQALTTGCNVDQGLSFYRFSDARLFERRNAKSAFPLFDVL